MTNTGHTTTIHPLRRVTRRCVLVLLTCVALLAASCSSQVEQEAFQVDVPRFAAGVVGVASSEAPHVFDDGLIHLIVETEPFATSIDPEGGEHGASRRVPASNAPAGTASATSPASATKTGIETHTRDGLIPSADIPDGTLRGVTPATAAEHALVDDPDVLFIAIDDTGAIGPAGARYVVYLDGVLLVGVATGTVKPDPGEAVPDELEPDEPDAEAAEPTTQVELDEQILADVLLLDEVDNANWLAPGMLQVAGTTGVEEAVLTVDGVVSVAEDIAVFVDTDAYQPYQWALDNTGDASQAGGRPGVAGADTNAPEAWETSTGSGLTIAVIDTGIDLNHQDLRDRVWTNTGETCGNGIDDDNNGFIDDCNGWDFGGGDNDPNPEAGTRSEAHGTHVAGLAGASRNGLGTVGIAPDVNLMALKAAYPSGDLSLSAVVAAIDYAVANGADIINLSLGTRVGVSRHAVLFVERAVADAAAAGVLIIASTGNEGVDTTTTGPQWPSGFALYYDEVMSIASSNNSDALSSWSTRGPEVSLMAPGEIVLSTVPGGGYNWMSGTSMAAPVTAGAAAVLWAAEPNLTPSQVADRLEATGASVGDYPRLDLAAAIDAAGSVPVSTSVVYSGADQLRADTDGSLTAVVAAEGVSSPTHLRLSIATRVNGQIAAVEGFTVDLNDSIGSLGQFVSDQTGALPNIPLRAAPDLANGVALDLDLNVPAGEYALVSEILDPDGNILDDAQVVYLNVTETGSTTTPPTTTAPSTGGSTSPTTTAPASGGGTSSTTTTAPSTGGSTSPTTTAPSTGGTTSPTTTTTPSTGGSTSPTTTTAPSTGDPTSPTTTMAPSTGGGTSPTTTTPSTGDPTSPTTTTPSTGGSTSPTTTTPSTGGSEDPTEPVTTTPPPQPVEQGDWAVTTMSPRSAPTTGGTSLVLEGVFPTTVPIYVWFGSDGPVVRATSTGDRLYVTSPSVDTTGVVDVSVRFSIGEAVNMTLADAFTFYESTTSPGTGWGGPTSPTTTQAPSSGGSTSPTTTAAPSTGGSTSPTTTTTTTTPPGSGGGSSPTTTAPASGGRGSSPTTTTAPGPIAQRGSQTLWAPSPSSPLSRLSSSRWPSTSCGASCTASTL